MKLFDKIYQIGETIGSAVLTGLFLLIIIVLAIQLIALVGLVIG